MREDALWSCICKLLTGFDVLHHFIKRIKRLDVPPRRHGEMTLPGNKDVFRYDHRLPNRYLQGLVEYNVLHENAKHQRLADTDSPRILGFLCYKWTLTLLLS